jgi:hypothetical protein
VTADGRAASRRCTVDSGFGVEATAATDRGAVDATDETDAVDKAASR